MLSVFGLGSDASSAAPNTAADSATGALDSGDPSTANAKALDVSHSEMDIFDPTFDPGLDFDYGASSKLTPADGAKAKADYALANGIGQGTTDTGRPVMSGARY
jgi:hypothetical protein